jgi:hypothetical protein
MKNPKSKKQSKKPFSEKTQGENKLTLFDHVKHIRTVQDPEYYNKLSEENKKSFNHFMLLRALSMDSDVLQEIAILYMYYDKIPSNRFYTVLISIVPKASKWVPWIKSKVIRYSDLLINVLAKHYKISRRQSNEYVTVLLSSQEGINNLIDICKREGFSDDEIEKIIDKKNYEI